MGMIRTLWTSKSNVNGAVSTATFIAHKGEIWYDNDAGQLRYSDGVTPGGIPIVGSGGSGGTYTLPIATTSTLGGIKIGHNLTIDPDGTLNAISSGTGSVSDTFSTISVTGQSNLVASGLDTLEFTAGTGIVITTNSSPTKSITITNDAFNATLDGGVPNSIYGGLAIVDGGGI